MRLSFLEPVYAEPGPYVSVYLDTSRNIEHPERAIALRWQLLRESLSRQGADRRLLNVLEEVVGTDTEVPGVHGQTLFAAHGMLVLNGELPWPPEHDSARYSTLPDAMPLITQHVPEIPYMAVVVHYGGLPTAETHGWVTLETETGTWPVSIVTPGERLHRRVAVATWHRTAPRLGQRLDERARHADAVVVGGDEWACNVLVRRLPHALRDKVVRVGGRTPTDTGRALLEPQLDGVFRGRMAAHDRELVDIFIGRRGRGRAGRRRVGAGSSRRPGRRRSAHRAGPCDLSGQVRVPPQVVSVDDRTDLFAGNRSARSTLGGRLAGIVGSLLAVPLAALIAVFWNYLREQLSGEGPEPDPDEAHTPSPVTS
ncbi:hypothetical protein [Streptomyces gardneri]|uniref:baeRF2 domain-containing protein n=1 Tax=Streptomyces gardneri TaxID=66892 RepID=UPI0033CD3027